MQALVKQPLANVKHIIVVGSGKGGVGKSTVSFLLALALRQLGQSVGLLDADIYGPSLPSMLGIPATERLVMQAQGWRPMRAHGLQSMSMGYLVDQQVPMVWRGPMISKMLQQMMHGTAWETLDFLIVDLPPGTGDIPLTLCQKLPLSGAVVVTTPQGVALQDVQRACNAFIKLGIPLCGIIENMSLYHCTACGHEEPIFGTGGGKTLAVDYGIPLLGQVPLDSRICHLIEQRCATEELTALPSVKIFNQFANVILSTYT